MILQALTRYYDILVKDPKIEISPFGYSIVDVSYAIELSPDGKLLDLIPLYRKVTRGKKLVDRPTRMVVPEQFKHTNKVSAFFLCDNSAYVLGISDKGKEYGEKRFVAFREFNVNLLTKVDSTEARAVISFLEKFNPSYADEHEAIARYWDDLIKGRRLVFRVGQRFVHDLNTVKQVWEEYYRQRSSSVQMQCLVTGKVAPIRRLHPQLKGIKGANSMGAALVSFNDRAYESYGREKQQGLNSPVSEEAAVAYFKALNYLLSDANPNGQMHLGDTTVVYWAESESRLAETIFSAFVDPDRATRDEFAARREAERALHTMAEHIRQGKMVDLDALLADLGDDNPRFYVLGLAPNAARVSVRFFITNPFRTMMEHVAAHYRDLEVVKEYEDQPTYLSVWRILNETVSKKARDKKASPLLAGAVFRSILTGAPYPVALYYAILNRVRADVDDKERQVRKINYVRAAVIKAYLLRKYRHHPQNPLKEVLTMSLNEQSAYPPYVLGRLFAWLERAQQAAIGKNINATIKDRYFTSASATPASVFPILLRLAQHHFAKAEYGGYIENQVESLMAKLEGQSFPARLTLDEQGAFILGYYHQRAAWKNDNSEASTQN